MKRVCAPEQTREQLRALIEGRLGTPPDRSSLVLLAARLLLGEALEGEVRDEIGPERHARADSETKGYRNGYRPGQIKTAEGMVEFSAPQVRDTPESFASAIRENLASRTQVLEDLAVEILCAWTVDPRHRGRLHGRDRPPTALPCGGERDHRAAVGGVRGLHQARSVRVPDRLSGHRWDCRAAARWPAA
jgi:Transposase, Mutator family